MINPIYKFEITSVYGQTVDNKTVYPIYGNDVTIDWQIEQNEQYYRGVFSGKLNFIGEDFNFINSKNFETEFELRIFISYNAGASWAQYWTGKFYKTDCEFDVDDKKITVTPTVSDEYNDIVAGLEKEYNLIELAPEIQHIQLDKRPMIQVYSPGESVIACFLSGMYWEQDCTAESDESKLTQGGDGKPNFALLNKQRIIDVEPSDFIGLPDVFFGNAPDDTLGAMEYANGGYTFKFYFNAGQYFWEIIRNSDNQLMWQSIDGASVLIPPYEVTLNPVYGPALGTVKLTIREQNIYARYVLDTEKLGDLDTYLLPDDDIVPNNRNYRRCIGYVDNVIYYSNSFSSTPTKYGIYQPGQYYKEPYILGINQFFPVARSAWGKLSIWFAFSVLDWITEEKGRKAHTLKDAYPLASVISVLLGQIAPNVLHKATPDYSQFLYGDYNPLSGDYFQLFITQKSNILAGDYDQPAQKAPATLKMITDMLRDCFRCYWFIEKAENGDLRFRIEHISWFLNGGSYSGAPVVGMDLTQMEVTRNGKKWAFATSKYTYNKPQMPERYQFGWMDDVTELFEGFPIDIQSKFVQPGNIEEINVANFTSDIDFMLLNPGACSEDGFALFATTYKDAYPVYSFATSAYPSIPSVSPFYMADDFQKKIRGKFIKGIKLNIVNAGIISVGYAENIVVGQSSLQSHYTLIKEFNVQPGVQELIFDSPILLNSNQWLGINRPGDTALFYYNAGLGQSNAINFCYSENNIWIQTNEDLEVGVILENVLPYINFTIQGTDHILQNAFMAFYYLQLFYLYDMPAEEIKSRNILSNDVIGIKKQKTQQLQYPVYSDPNLYQLVKTNMGNGQIEKISINLSSRSAKTTLRYDTE